MIIMKLCSACLLGIKCRYDGTSNSNEKILQLAKKEILIPVCPEQLGGLPTPRHPSEIREGRVFTKSGKDVTKEFVKGAEEVLKIAKLMNIKEAILKQRSPSCGSGKVGLLSGETAKGDGFTAALLKRNGIKVRTEEDF